MRQYISNKFQMFFHQYKNHTTDTKERMRDQANNVNDISRK